MRVYTLISFCYLLNLAGITGEDSYGLKENKLFSNQWKPCASIELGSIWSFPLQVERVHKDAFMLIDKFPCLSIPDDQNFIIKWKWKLFFGERATSPFCHYQDSTLRRPVHWLTFGMRFWNKLHLLKLPQSVHSYQTETVKPWDFLFLVFYSHVGKMNDLCPFSPHSLLHWKSTPVLDQPIHKI